MNNGLVRSWGDDQGAKPYDRLQIQSYANSPARTQAVRVRRFVAALNMLEYRLEQAEMARDGSRVLVADLKTDLATARQHIEALVSYWADPHMFDDTVDAAKAWLKGRGKSE